MNSNACPYETQVAQAARTGCWDHGIREHFRRCPRCGEVARISEWMKTFAAIGEESTLLPDPERIWMNARVLAAEMARKRVLRPLVIAELIVRLALALGLAAGIAWLWHDYASLTSYFRPPQLLILKPLLTTIAALGASVLTLALLRLVLPVLKVDW